MGLTESLGLSGVFNSSSGANNTGTTIGIIILSFVLLVFVGGITFFVYSKKLKNKLFKNKIPIFVEVNGKIYRVGIDDAKELFVPDSNVSLFYLRGRKIYIARPTRAMGKDEYWYKISSNGEWINFDLASAAETSAIINYDHRDTRYAYTNLKDIIKRNYKDKSLVWWKDPTIMNIISFVIMSLIFVGGIIFILSREAILIDKLAIVVEKMNPIVDSIEKSVQTAQNLNSGVISAG